MTLTSMNLNESLWSVSKPGWTHWKFVAWKCHAGINAGITLTTHKNSSLKIWSRGSNNVNFSIKYPFGFTFWKERLSITKLLRAHIFQTLLGELVLVTRCLWLFAMSFITHLISLLLMAVEGSFPLENICMGLKCFNPVSGSVAPDMLF